MGFKLLLILAAISVRAAHAEGVVNVIEIPQAAQPMEISQSLPDAAPSLGVTTEVSPSVVQVFSQQDSAPTETQQFGAISHEPSSGDGSLSLPLKSASIIQ